MLIDGGIRGLGVRREDGVVVDFASFLRETYTDSLVVVTRDGVAYED